MGEKTVQVLTHEKRTSKVVILGYAPSSRDLAPFKDEAFEIWGMNELYLFVPRVDVLFDVHDYELMKSKERNPKHLEWLQKATIPIYMQKHFDDIPRSIPLPLPPLVKDFGSYYTNSVSYMIALAAWMKYEQIHLYGIDMATDVEYQIQRPSVEYFVGIAVGMGIDVYIPPQSDICKSPFLYGFEDAKRSEVRLKMDARQKELQGRVNQLQGQIDQMTAQLNQFGGALDDVGYWKRTWVFDTKEPPCT